jgi:hypothetical protein
MTDIIAQVAAFRENLAREKEAIEAEHGKDAKYDPHSFNSGTGYNQPKIRDFVGALYLNGKEDAATVEALRQLTRALMTDPKVSGITRLEVLDAMIRNDSIVPTPEEMQTYAQWFVEYARNRQGGFLDWSLKIPRRVESEQPAYAHIADGLKAAYQGVLDNRLWDEMRRNYIQGAVDQMSRVKTKPYQSPQGNPENPAGGLAVEATREKTA